MDIMRRVSLLRTWRDRLKKKPDTARKRRFRISPITDDFSVLSIARRGGAEGSRVACYVACLPGLAPSLPLFLQKHHHLLSSAPLGRRRVILLKNQPAIAHSTADPGDYSLLRRKGGLLNNEILA